MALDGETFVCTRPNPCAIALAEVLGKKRRILDVGCSWGRRTAYLAEQGHYVVGIDRDPHAIKEAQITVASRLGERALELCTLIQADIFDYLDDCTLPFDAIVAADLIYELGRDEGMRLLEAMRNTTKGGGFNSVSNYLLEGTGDDKGFCRPGELHDLYRGMGWNVAAYEEIYGQDIISGEQRWVTSNAYVVAQKPIQVMRQDTWVPDIEFYSAQQAA